MIFLASGGQTSEAAWASKLLMMTFYKFRFVEIFKFLHNYITLIPIPLRFADTKTSYVSICDELTTTLVVAKVIRFFNVSDFCKTASSLRVDVTSSDDRMPSMPPLKTDKLTNFFYMAV